METDDRGRARVGVWARDATTTADVGNVNTSVPFRVKGGVRAATGDTTVRTSVIANADIGPPHDHRSDEQPGESAERRDV